MPNKEQTLPFFYLQHLNLCNYIFIYFVLKTTNEEKQKVRYLYQTAVRISLFMSPLNPKNILISLPFFFSY